MYIPNRYIEELANRVDNLPETVSKYTVVDMLANYLERNLYYFDRGRFIKSCFGERDYRSQSKGTNKSDESASVPITIE